MVEFVAVQHNLQVKKFIVGTQFSCNLILLAKILCLKDEGYAQAVFGYD